MVEAHMIITGVVLSLLGMYFLHRSSKVTPWIHRMCAVGLAMSGAYVLWAAASMWTPPVNDIRITVVGKFDDQVIAHYKTSNTRNCKLEGIDALITLDNGKKFKAKTEIAQTGKEDGGDTGIISIEGLNRYDASKVNLTAKHFCPFGFELKTEISEIKVNNIPEIQ